MRSLIVLAFSWLYLSAPGLSPAFLALQAARAARSYLAEASWYGPGFDGRHTASGIRFRRNLPILAHRWLPFGTRVLLRCNGRRAVGIVLDRGPFVRGRSFDLSQGLARSLGILEAGKAVLSFQELDVLPPGAWNAALAEAHP